MTKKITHDSILQDLEELNTYGVVHKVEPIVNCLLLINQTLNRINSQLKKDPYSRTSKQKGGAIMKK